jgi:hypothetical protein
MTAITHGLNEPPRPRIRLVKQTAVFGSAPVGHVYEVVGKPDDDRYQLRGRAYRMLERSMPGENPLEWKVDGEDGAE